MLQRNKSEAQCFLELEHCVQILPLLEKKNSQWQCTFFKLEIISDKSVIRNCLEITLLMSNLLKHGNYLNTVLKSPKSRCLTQVPKQQIAEV